MQIFGDENGRKIQFKRVLFAYLQKKQYLCTRKGLEI